MPTQIEYDGEGIFYTRWTDPLTWEDIDGQIKYVQGYASEHGIDRLVVIIDLSNCSRIPMEVQNLRQRVTEDQHTIGYVVVKTNLLAKVAVRMLDRLTAREYRDAETPEEAIALARDMLRKHEQVKQ
ncbi:MAG: hypothetical protein KC547_21165 [Anaerolineae bacterium]|nr:hypothetical protein [Anaerolineae bacterium]MCA9907791.1 hypothetical protein [Anaerolineae bacterium]